MENQIDKKFRTQSKNIFNIWVWKKLNYYGAQNIFFVLQILHQKMIHCCEAPRSMLSNYFGEKEVRRCTFGEIWHIQIQMYCQTYFEQKYGPFYLKTKSVQMNQAQQSNSAEEQLPLKQYVELDQVIYLQRSNSSISIL